MVPVPTVVNYLIESRGLKLGQLATLCGACISSIVNWRKGHKTPPPATRMLLELMAEEPVFYEAVLHKSAGWFEASELPRYRQQNPRRLTP